MPSPLPNDLALTVLPDGSPAIASNLRNNYAAIQAAVNALRDALAGGAAGQIMQAVDGTHIGWATPALANIAAGTQHSLALSGATVMGSLPIGPAGYSLQSGGPAADPSWGTLATYRTTALVDVVNSTAETDLLNGLVTVAAAALGTNKMLRLTAFGDWKQNSAGSQNGPQFKLKLGGVTLLDTGAGGAATVSSVPARFPWRFVCEIANIGAANSQQAYLTGRVGYNTGAGAAWYQTFVTGSGIIYWPAGASHVDTATLDGTGAGAVDTTVNQSLAFTVTLPVAHANCDFACRGAFVEIL